MGIRLEIRLGNSTPKILIIKSAPWAEEYITIYMYSSLLCTRSIYYVE